MRPRYCCFYLHQRLRLGWIREERGTHVDLVLADGDTVQQRAANLLYSWPGEPVADENAAVDQLARYSESLSESAHRVDRVYERMTPGRPVPFESAAALAPDDAPGWPRGLLFAGLLSDSERFRFSKDAFTSRAPEEVAERRQREAQRRADSAWIERAQHWRDQLEAGHWDDNSEAAQTFLKQLQSMLALERRSPYWPLLSKPLGLHSLHLLDLATRLRGWLELAQDWPGWPAIWLLGAEVERDFSPALIEAAEQIAALPVQRKGRRVFDRAPVFTIDGEDTRDFDDAFSVLEADPRGLTVAMHIAEPPISIQSGTPLFDEALRRMASVYTLEGIFPMFPEVLSTGRFSLNAGEVRECVTFILRVEDGDGHLLGVERGLVRVERNLTHTDAQTLLDDQADTWGRLATLCGSLADSRGKAGAVIIERREVALDVSNPAQIRVQEVLRSGPSYQLVEELAILHNREAGRYCRTHGIPAIYRVQAPARGAGVSVGDDREMPLAARFSTLGGPHTGLACDRYIQTTSPIRRFADLAMQRQIVEHAVSGHIAFESCSELERWAERADSRLSSYDDVKRRIDADWKRRYLLQHRGAIFKGTAQRRKDSGQGRVWLTSLQMVAQCTLPTAVRDGDPVTVRVESVDRDHQTVWVACTE